MNPLIRKLDHLHPLDQDEIDVLEQACTRVVEIRADQDIINEGDKPRHCTLLLEGMTFRYKILGEGKRQIFAFHVPGDIYDAQSFLLETMDHSICALTACKLALIPHETMRRFTEEYPRIARAVWKDTLVDAAIFREWMASIGRRSAYERIAHLMCEMFMKLQVVGLIKDDTISWPITQNELGDALGLSVVHVNRTLQELRGDGLIALHGTTLRVNDWEGLKKVALFHPRYLHFKPAPREGFSESRPRR